VLEVRYEWSLSSWAIRSKPVATGITQSYVEPIRNSLQKTIGGLSLLPQEHAKTMLPALYKGV
jgi:hypothetical protein